MSALLRGLNEGLQTGMQLGSTLRDARRRRELAEAAKQYGVTEGAYGPDLQQNIQQLEGLKKQDPEQAPAYDQAIQELQRRSEMTAPDFSIASGARDFGTREEATRAARPMRAEGLANVYERYGDIEQAEALRERADTARLREIQRQSAEIGLETQQQTAQEARRLQAFNAEFDPRMAPEELQELVKKHNLTRRQHLGILEELNGLETGELAQFESQMKNLIKGKSLSQLVQLYTEDERLDPETGARVRKSRDGKTTLEFFDKASGDVLESQTFGSEALALQALRIRAVEPGQLAEWQLGIRATEMGIAQKEAQIRASDAQVRASDAKAAQPRMRELTDFENTQLKAYNKWLEEPRNANAAQGVKDTKLRELGIPDIFVGRSTSQTGLRDWNDAVEEQPAEPVAGATDEPATTQPRTAMTRGEARQNARVRAELNQQFEALPEVQAMIRQLESARAGLRRGGRDDTRALSAQIAQMREQFIAERMGLR